MANIPLKVPHFVSFDKDLNILAHDIHKDARFIYHASQDYFIQGNPSDIQKNSMRNKYKEAMSKLQTVKKTYND